jgi:hypothetical protein
LVTSHPAGESPLETNAWLRSTSKHLDYKNITPADYQLQLKLEKGAFRLNNNVSTKHKDIRAELYAGLYGESMYAFKLLTSYNATERAAAQRVDSTKGINISLVAQHYYDQPRGKSTSGGVADDRRKADSRLSSANKDAQWIDVQLSRIVFKDHREGLPQRFKNMPSIGYYFPRMIISEARKTSAPPSKQALHLEIESFSSSTVLLAELHRTGLPKIHSKFKRD